MSYPTYGLTFDALREANVKRCEQSFHPLDSWSETDWATAAAGDLGEACNLIKKRRRGETILATEVGKEIADTIIYLDLLAARLGLDLSVIVAEKFNAVSERVGSEVGL